MFNHELFEEIDLEQINTPNGRYYLTKDGFYLPSVTTVISRQSDQTWLNNWKKRVGEDKANRIKTQAANRGTAVHSIFEKFLLNENYKDEAMPVNLASFLSIKPILEKHINKIYGIEYRIASKALNTAGSIDAIVSWDSKPTILDLKTSKRIKDESDIQYYIVQAICYAKMFNETWNTQIEQIVIVMIVDHHEPLIFLRQIDDYENEFNQIFRGSRCLENLRSLPAP